MNHRSLTEEPRAALGGTRGPHGWEGLTYDRWNQGCAQKEAAGKAACGHIPGSPRPCGNRPKVSPTAEEPWLGRADPWGRKEPELGSPVSSDESLALQSSLHCQAGPLLQEPFRAQGCSLLCPELRNSLLSPKAQPPGRAAMVEIHLKGPIYRVLLTQCCLYPQAPTLKVGPTPSGLWLRALDALQIRHEPGPSPEGTEVLDTSAGRRPCGFCHPLAPPVLDSPS